MAPTSEPEPGQSTAGTSRRALLATASLAAVGVPLATAGFATPVAAAPAHGAPVLAETSAGLVRGARRNGINTFLGIPYGASTGGANRFRPPQPAVHWRGVRDATEFGHIAPQPIPAGRLDYTLLIDWLNQPGGQSEDCLVLNVWTPSQRGKRPVLVSFHGGGFTSGSGNHAGFNGAPLAEFGDVVVVTVNHRLGAMGFMHLADLGAPAEWATSGVNGMLDCVASLRWVQENIGNFGGDPSRVMIFGQSGGGAKTSALMAMPSAQGLFHRAAVQSGSALTLATRASATTNAANFLNRLGLTTARITELRDVPLPMMVAVQAALEAGTPPAVFAPVVDGTVLPRDPFSPTAPEISRTVPMIISTVLDEAAGQLTNFDLTDAGLTTLVTTLVGAAVAPRVLSAYQGAYPTASPFFRYVRILTDRGAFRSANTQAERKAALGGAPAYKYLFTWPSPASGGKFGAVHGTDVSLALHNTAFPITGDGRDARANQLADQLATAWVNFARTGNPNGAGLPTWPTFDATDRATLIFDPDATRVVNDPLHDLRLLWNEILG